MILKCIKCGSRDGLQPYTYITAVDGTVKYRYLRPRLVSVYQRVDVPVCESCRREFDHHQALKKRPNTLFILTFFLAMVIFGTLCILYIMRPFLGLSLEDLIFLAIISVLPELLLTIYTIIITRQVANLPSNPNRYFKNRGRGRLYVRAQGEKKWMKYEDWAREAVFS